ncbi:unnamed protein product [Rhodiola kirilowii]
MNRKLLVEFSEVEIREALFQICPPKAPGPDGFSALFYHKCWNIVKADVVRVVAKCLNDNSLDPKLNNTDIVLIPKCKDANKMEDFRPINLCNVIVKIMTKAMANRLQSILDKVISLNQSAFVKGRLITDNILLAQELNHFIRSRRNGSRGYASLKVDMSKAYDRLEWAFIEQMLLKLGFDRMWVNKVMLCITTVSYRVKVNSWYTNTIIPRKGLRQGDPLSLYIFILCSKWLSLEIEARCRTRFLSGIKICRGVPNITHLFFADDCMIYARATEEDFAELKDILDRYEEVFGQRINFSKSDVLFSRNVDPVQKKLLANLMGVLAVQSHSKYLGLPLVMGQRKSDIFRFILDKVWSRVNGWKQKLLSIVGKEILIKSVLMATPLRNVLLQVA